MPIVAGVDFGTLSVRVTLVDTSRGRLASGVAESLSTGRKMTPTMPRKATTITCAPSPKPCSARWMRPMSLATKSHRRGNKELRSIGFSLCA